MGPHLRIENHNNGQRLDAVLARTYPQYSRSFFQKFLRRGGVTLSGTPREPSYRVHAGEVFKIASLDVTPAKAEVQSLWIPASAEMTPHIISEDDSLLVINKPAGLVVHPAPGHRGGTLIDWLKGHLGSKVLKIFTDPERLGL